MKKMLFAAAAMLALTGCFTVSQTDYPQVEITPAPEAAPPVAVSGFEATVTTFIPVTGYATVWQSSPAYYHRGHYHGFYDYPTTVATSSYIPQQQLTTEYVEKAQKALESAGYVIGQTNAACVVSVKFGGPIITDGDRMAEFASMLFTAFTADYTTEQWTASLKITDTASGRVIFTRDYVQDYAATVWGLVPIFSPLAADAVQDDYIQGWALSALTDRAMADATAFLATAFKQPDK